MRFWGSIFKQFVFGDQWIKKNTGIHTNLKHFHNFQL